MYEKLGFKIDEVLKTPELKYIMKKLSKYNLLSIFAMLIHSFVTKIPIPINSNTSSKACRNSKLQILLSVEPKFSQINRPGISPIRLAIK